MSDKKCGCKKVCNCGKRNLECDCDVIHEELVKRVKQKMLDEETFGRITEFYKAMADGTRLKILNLLEGAELCVCDISYILNMTKSAVSHQLKYLKELNLVKGNRQGKEIWYSLADRHVKEVFDISLEHILEEDKGEENC